MYGHFASCCHGTSSSQSGWTCFILLSVSVGGNGLQALIIVLICLIVDKTDPKNNTVCFRLLRREQGYQKRKRTIFGVQVSSVICHSPPLSNTDVNVKKAEGAMHQFFISNYTHIELY